MKDNYKGDSRSYRFPHGQIFRFDVLYVVALWRGGKLYFQKLTSYLMEAEGLSSPAFEFYAYGDDLAAIGSNQGMMPLTALHDTYRSVHKSV